MISIGDQIAWVKGKLEIEVDELRRQVLKEKLGALEAEQAKRISEAAKKCLGYINAYSKENSIYQPNCKYLSELFFG